MHTVCVQLYTEWVNHFLQKANSDRRVTNLQTDLTDTQLLSQLVEAVGMLCYLFIYLLIIRPFI